tara:strand:+ start:38 stop:970 length:933 start_codon:yes stop_codon:yes gene_type:complete
MIIITGSSGFIGGALVRYLVNNSKKIILCDFINNQTNNSNITFIKTNQLFSFIDEYKQSIDLIYHLGAITDTTCTDEIWLNKYNFEFSVSLWNYCVKYSIPLIYASSAATYGDGTLGFIDDHHVVDKLMPLNLYAKSKNDFDKFVLKENDTPPTWFGLKFFNVFGFDESKKANMSSIVYQAFNKINSSNEMCLFKSYNKDFEDGFQERDFVYIDDVINVLIFLMNNNSSGIYNLGSGKATSFVTLIENVFKSMKKKSNIKFIEMPISLRDKYQYSTRADLNKIRSIGYNKSFVEISDAIEDYISNYLIMK